MPLMVVKSALEEPLALGVAARPAPAGAAARSARARARRRTGCAGARVARMCGRWPRISRWSAHRQHARDGALPLGADQREERARVGVGQLRVAARPRRCRRAPSASCALSTSARKNGDSRCSSRMRSSPSCAISASSAEPSPNQPGMPCRLWFHENTHGIARRSASARPGRRELGPRADRQRGDLVDRRGGLRVAREPVGVGEQLLVGAQRHLGRPRRRSRRARRARRAAPACARPGPRAAPR